MLVMEIELLRAKIRTCLNRGEACRALFFNLLDVYFNALLQSYLNVRTSLLSLIGEVNILLPLACVKAGCVL